MSAQVHFVSAGPATYANLEAVPVGYTAELVNGRLHALPRPKGKHIHSASVLGRRLGALFEDGVGGLGGWWILDEPEVHVVLDTEVTVPDLAGWRRERLPSMPEDHRFQVVTDWICEVLSPTSRDYDLNEKLPLYARHSVPFVWLIEPDAPWLEALILDGGSFHPIGRFGPGQAIQAPPFEAVAFHLFENKPTPV